MLISENKKQKIVIQTKPSHYLPQVKNRSVSLRSISPAFNVKPKIQPNKPYKITTNKNNRQSLAQLPHKGLSMKILTKQSQQIQLHNNNNNQTNTQLRHYHSEQKKNYLQMKLLIVNENKGTISSTNKRLSNDNQYEDILNIFNRKKRSQNYQTIDLWKLKCNSNNVLKNMQSKKQLKIRLVQQNQSSALVDSSPKKYIDMKKNVFVNNNNRQGIMRTMKINQHLRNSPNIKSIEIQTQLPEEVHIEKASYFSKDRELKSKMMELRQMTSKQLLKHYQTIQNQILQQKRKQKHKQQKKLPFQTNNPINNNNDKQYINQQIIGYPSRWNTKNIQDSLSQHQQDQNLDLFIHKQTQNKIKTQMQQMQPIGDENSIQDI